MPLSYDRWQELMQYAPQITDNDIERLQNTRPRLPLLAIHVRLALVQLGVEHVAKQMRDNAGFSAALRQSMKPVPGSETEKREQAGLYEHRTYTNPAVQA